ncbi:helix-turn-helix domain-containing protein [Wukongibacter sp. M2B1]|uniref:helix-turn-helix domain-containing protein n=1 Tax=Wukongibacter sp. M2B1 TaxID=3088895 RepID=UPI003D78E574
MSSFSKEDFAQLLKKAKGERSINQYALHSGVSSAHISRLLRSLLDTAPSPETIKKLSDKAYNSISYFDLMNAAGHMTVENKEIETDISEENIKKLIPVLFNFSINEIKSNYFERIRQIILERTTTHQKIDNAFLTRLKDLIIEFMSKSTDVSWTFEKLQGYEFYEKKEYGSYKDKIVEFELRHSISKKELIFFKQFLFFYVSEYLLDETEYNHPTISKYISEIGSFFCDFEKSGHISIKYKEKFKYLKPHFKEYENVDIDLLDDTEIYKYLLNCYNEIHEKDFSTSNKQHFPHTLYEIFKTEYEKMHMKEDNYLKINKDTDTDIVELIKLFNNLSKEDKSEVLTYLRIKNDINKNAQ